MRAAEQIKAEIMSLIKELNELELKLYRGDGPPLTGREKEEGIRTWWLVRTRGGSEELREGVKI